MGYPGGKAGAGVVHRIINLIPPHDVYIEPFLGDAAVMRAKRPARLNIGLDLDPQSPGLAWLDGLAEKKGAAAVIVRSGEARRSSAGLARVDRLDRVSPELAVSADLARFGEITWVKPPREYSHSANGDPGSHGGNGEAADYRYGCLDGIEFLRVYPFTGRDLVYCDPPYVMSTRSGRRLYKHEMSDDDHRRFLRVIRDLPCMVMVSGYWCSLYVDTLRGWGHISFEAMTRAGHTATEWLWFNFPEPTVLHDDQYLGEGFRERERLKRKKARWVARLRAMPQLDRQALLSAIASIDASNE